MDDSRFTQQITFKDEENLGGNGIEILYDPIAKEIRFQAWYDQGCGFGGEKMTMPLQEFLERLGIAT